MPTSKPSLPPRVVVLTGASSGIGRATALEFARRGARLVLAARGRVGLEAVVHECERIGAEAIAVPTDVTDAAAVRALGAAALARFGHVDVWINNVGVGVVGLFDRTPLEAHRRVVESNLIGHMNGAHVALAHFRQRGQGTLVNMISVGGFVPTPYAASYAASKFGLRGLSESLRAEVSALPHVHVCEVYPGFVDTPGIAHGGNHTGRHLEPPPPVLDPREVAAAIADLAEAPRAAVTLGSSAIAGRIAHAIAPDLAARATMKAMETGLAAADPAPVSDGNLFEPSIGTAIDGGYRRGRESAGLRGVSLAVAAIGLALGWWMVRGRGREAAA